MRASRWRGPLRALEPLTLRGRAFVAAGATALVCAVLFDQDSLARVGGLALALPLVALVVQRRAPRAQVRRVLAPDVVRAGETTQVSVSVSSGRSRRTPSTWQVEETLPYALGSRPRFLITGLGAQGSATASYQVRPEVRGRYAVGPLLVRTGDPFGFTERRTETGGVDALVVTPRVLPLPGVALRGGWQGSGDHRPQAFAAGSSEDVSVRDYRRGDDLRRVHWRSSARTGDLMVRREEQPWEAQATVLLDDRARAHRGEGRASSLEAAIVAAASVIAHLRQHGFSVQLVTSRGVVATSEPAALRHLAELGASSSPGLPATWSGERRGGVVVAVLGSVGDDDSTALRRLRHDADIAWALALDVGAWSAAHGSRGPDEIARSLESLGWRARSIGPRDRLDTVWNDLAAGAGTAGARR